MSAKLQAPPVNLERILGGEIRHKVEKDPLTVWDKGVFLNELHNQGLVLKTDKSGATSGEFADATELKKGTYHGTKLALTELYSMIEETAVSQFDSKNFESIIPIQRSIEQKQDTYNWSDGTDNYPPHLAVLPDDQTDQKVGPIFNKEERDNVTDIAGAFSLIIPSQVEERNGVPYAGPTIADTEIYNHAHKGPPTDIMNGENIGNLPDWYSDARFAQQHLSGVNPSTIEVISSDRLNEFSAEAGKQGAEGIGAILTTGKDILIQDYSYFREAVGASDDTEFVNVIPVAGGKPVSRYACAPIVVFQLHEDGRLHPLAITLDYRGSLDKSITIFNQRLNPDDKGEIDEKQDWPWRYAKTCAQTADWARHEIATHLVDTHLIEEAIIVATNRTFKDGHIIYEILSPHWYRTLALNQAARMALVPGVIARLAGFGPNPAPGATNNVYKMVNWSYKNFNFQDKYIPNDLKKRGFNLKEEMTNKYRNYPYATDMLYLWEVLRDFVKSVLETQYTSDAKVQADAGIAAWCTEIQTKGQITSFPTITTLEQLIDAVTMCIHIASPQHTAVNYLQDYYYSFVPSKPPALCTRLPKDLATLKTYTEAELTAALPIGTNGPQWKDWLLAAQLPELLSYKVEGQYNLITYAKSLYNVHKARPAFKGNFDSKTIKEAAALFYSRLKDCELAFQWVSANQTEGTVEYKVLEPELTAVSILI
ncbi:unnamed protein product [Clonostachys byssicola]|uniref:Manganese lipoxygenase n=1 Tax=Clonostachys byssicola TaxID=160290 RepID=A0A9N9U766_9HYPO|nr:unnamed protein product [Clonostachys byssicola]